jgi:hypothetical protein
MKIIENARSSGRHGLQWDALDRPSRMDMPANLRKAWPVWVTVLALIAVVVLVAAWVLA